MCSKLEVLDLRSLFRLQDLLNLFLIVITRAVASLQSTQDFLAESELVIPVWYDSFRKPSLLLGVLTWNCF